MLIFTELYRLLIFYLREHRVSVALAIDISLVGALRTSTILGVHEFDLRRLAGFWVGC